MRFVPVSIILEASFALIGTAGTDRAVQLPVAVSSSHRAHRVGDSSADTVKKNTKPHTHKNNNNNAKLQ